MAQNTEREITPAFRAIIDSIKGINLADVLDEPELRAKLASWTAWEEYSEKTVPIIWDEIQERVARQHREGYKGLRY